jgi:hypothetical protein
MKEGIKIRKEDKKGRKEGMNERINQCMHA